MLQRFLEKIRRSAPLLSLLLGLGLLIPRPTFAWSIFSIGDILSTMVGKMVFIASYLISIFFGILIGVEAWFLQVILHLNFAVINSAVVKFGFPVALSFANLMFVFAIIVIGVMTILRFQSYGVKQALWKLIVIAVAVNFGLVICAGILQFSNELSLYFLAAVDPTNAVGGADNGLSSLNNFASALAGAFNPQKAFLFGLNNISVNGTDVGDLDSFTTASFANAGGTIGGIVTPLISVFFTIVFFIFLAISLGALIVMLIVRYVYLGYLLILLPLAWACWIFPITQKHWSKWWDNFIRYTMFPPIVLFFLWLVIQTSYQMNAGQSGLDFSLYRSDSNPVWAAVSEFFTNLFVPIIQTGLQMVILIALLLGGLMTANSMSIAGASAAKDLAMKPVNAMRDFAKNRAKRAGNRIMDRARTSGQKTEGGDTTTRLQRWGSTMQKQWGLRDIGASLAKQGSLANVNEARKGEMEDIRRDFEHLSREGIINRVQSTNAAKDPLTAAALAQEVARRRITRDPGIKSYMDGLTNAAARIGNVQEVYNNRPDLAMDPARLPYDLDPATGKPKLDASGNPMKLSPEAAFAAAVRKIKTDKIHEIDSSVLNDPALGRQAVLAMSTNQLGSLGANGNELQKNAVAKTAQSLYAQLENDRASGGPIRFTDAEVQQIDRIAKHFKNSPNWQDLS